MDQQSQVHKSLVYVIIKTPETTVFEGEVLAVSSINSKGPFDILLDHENFISIIKQKIILHLKDRTTKEIPINTGVMKVYANTVEIFLDVESKEK